jgi:phosphoserine phosphatase
VPLIGHDDTLVGVLQVLNKHDGVFTAEDERIATALAAQCAVALQRARMLTDLLVKERMEREIAVARDIQMRVFPKKMPAIAGYDVAGWSRPADQTGGDVYDVVGLEGGRAMLLLGDATGHGIGPALSVTQVRAMLRVALRLGADLDSAFRHINDQLSSDLADNRFVTAFLGVLDPASHTITYHAGGQGPLLHFRAADGTIASFGSTAMAMGMLPTLKMKKPVVLEMASGDIFALMTDGIFEYARADGEMFEEPRVGELLRAHRNEPMARLIEIIVEAVAAFAAGAPQGDDMTILLTRRLPS